MLDSLPPLSQPITSALDAHIQRRNADTRESRHLFVAHFLDLLQEKRFPQHRVQLMKRSLNKLFVFAGPRRTSVRRVQQKRFLANEYLFAVSTSCGNAP